VSPGSEDGPLPDGIAERGRRDVIYITADDAVGPFETQQEYIDHGQAYWKSSMDAYVLARHAGTAILTRGAAAPDGSMSIAEIARALEELPDLRLVREVVVVDGTHPLDRWASKTLGDGTRFLSMIEQALSLSVTLYRPVDAAKTRAALANAWWAFAWNVRAETTEFESIGEEEPFVLIPRQYERGPTEGADRDRWCALGEVILGPNPDAASVLASLDPRRSTIMARVLWDVLTTVPSELRSRRYSDFMDVAEYLLARTQ